MTITAQMVKSLDLTEYFMSDVCILYPAII